MMGVRVSEGVHAPFRPGCLHMQCLVLTFGCDSVIYFTFVMALEFHFKCRNAKRSTRRCEQGWCHLSFGCYTACIWRKHKHAVAEGLCCAHGGRDFYIYVIGGRRSKSAFGNSCVLLPRMVSSRNILSVNILEFKFRRGQVHYLSTRGST